MVGIAGWCGQFRTVLFLAQPDTVGRTLFQGSLAFGLHSGHHSVQDDVGEMESRQNGKRRVACHDYRNASRVFLDLVFIV